MKETRWRVARLPDGSRLESITLSIDTDDPEIVDAIELAAHQAGVVLGRQPATPPHLRPIETDAERTEPKR